MMVESAVVEQGHCRLLHMGDVLDLSPVQVCPLHFSKRGKVKSGLIMPFFVGWAHVFGT